MSAPAKIEGKDPFVHLPASIIFTPRGLEMVGASPALKKVTSRDGLPKEGLQSDSYNAQTIQKLVMKSCIEEIYVALPDLLRKRFEIISTNNLIVYGVLYKKLTPSLARTLFESSVVKEYNRKNPKNSIVDLNHISPQKVEQLQKTSPELIEGIKSNLRTLITERILGATNLNEEDQHARVRSLPRFLDRVDPRIWFVYYVISHTGFKSAMERTFASMIYSYLHHTQIATHLSNLLMEFIQNAEKAHFERLIVRHGLADKGAVDYFLRDAENRRKVTALAQKTSQMLELSWTMNPERNTIGQQYRILISISNYGIIDERVSQSLARKMKTNTDGISLASFYGNDEEDGKLGAGLGLLYNSYLEDICRQEGIQYRCNIYPEPKREKTTVRIDMTL
ncbi:MAG: hypothetical protein KDK37_07880 [Leptospiraceae bacterium]|nr:hypothetical protein [Leptospiraceae bacterium]MCB1304180.1 hypothetical protein [Leptospiraceae bacterium]